MNLRLLFLQKVMFAGELLTLPSRNDREFGEYLSLMTVLCEISTSQSQENVHANQSSIIESLPVSPIPVEDSEPAQEEIDIFLVPDDLIPPGVMIPKMNLMSHLTLTIKMIR
ncbi:hypothetical protein Tco_1399366 [Tanacetum coccineum]